MKTVLTGSNGTLGSILLKYLKSLNFEVVPWNREEVSIDSYSEMELFLKKIKPDVLFHLAALIPPKDSYNESWKVNCEWPSQLAVLSKKLKIQFLFTSSVMVFSDSNYGPFVVDSKPDANHGYGYEKFAAEKYIRKNNQEAVITRLGWQIGESAGSNNMIDYFETQMKENGEINASDLWFPACSFLSETVVVLLDTLRLGGGTYLIDSNKEWSFYDICKALKIYRNCSWKIKRTSDFKCDQRMIDHRIQIAPLKKQLLTL